MKRDLPDDLSLLVFLPTALILGHTASVNRDVKSVRWSAFPLYELSAHTLAERLLFLQKEVAP